MDFKTDITKLTDTYGCRHPFLLLSLFVVYLQYEGNPAQINISSTNLSKNRDDNIRTTTYQTIRQAKKKN